MMPDTQAQLIDLQTRLAFQEDTLQALNRVVAEQDRELVKLHRQLAELARKFDDLSYEREQRGSGEPPPPHY